MVDACLRCNEPLTKAANFCPNCGAKVKTILKGKVSAQSKLDWSDGDHNTIIERPNEDTNGVEKVSSGAGGDAGWKVLMVLVVFAVSILGFMIKLPSAFRRIDKELHASFYFFAALFLNIFFTKRSLFLHSIVFFILLGFGLAIEFSQAYSNRYFRIPIHGRFDPEDVRWNIIGLVTFSGIWLFFSFVTDVRKRK